jgi:hypothetical protein
LGGSFATRARKKRAGKRKRIIVLPLNGLGKIDPENSTPEVKKSLPCRLQIEKIGKNCWK